MARRSERGMATLWAVCWMAVCLSVAWIAMIVASAVAAQHHVDAAADLVALSAAGRLQRGGNACGAAADVADANDVRLRSCVVTGDDVMIEVGVRLDLPFGLDPEAVSAARAGPS